MKRPLLGLLLLAALAPAAHAKYAIEKQIDIDAAPEKTWAVLSDIDKWPEWNPFIHYAKGTLAVGNSLDVLVQPTGAKPIKGKGKVLVLEPGRRMVWVAKPFGAWILRGEHTFAVEPLPDGKSRFVQSETFTGILVPLLKGKFRRETEPGFLEMNAALKKRVEGK
ncbi:MAG TPA: SRPBCC domain-containing protein [Elusimicrobiota bacterium]|jgi:hypothetical protein|nr:SRPBCC domain-containing protein [Elusimicrobiota bacterium]